MHRKSIILITLFIFTLGLIFTTPSVAQRMRGRMHHGGMMGGGEMGIIHQLFDNHNQIRRTVEEIPGGIRAVTESDNPEIAALIQEHVSRMYQRIDNGQVFPMIRMSPTLPVMFRNANRYQRQLEITPKGIVVTETSQDRDMVAVIREHARDVNGFVEEGMPMMHRMRMR